MHLFRSSICWPDCTQRRLPVLSPPLPRYSRAHEIGELAWTLSRARRGRTRRKERKFSPLPSPRLAYAREQQYSRALPACISCALQSLSSYFVFSLHDTHNETLYQNENFSRNENRNDWLVLEPNFASVLCEQMQRNVWGWNELFPEWSSFRYHVNSSKGMLRYIARILIIPTIFISRVEKRGKVSSGKFLIADPVAVTVTERAVMLLLKSYPL